MPVPGSKSKKKPTLLDLFCGAGGCSVGYARAGFEVMGVDVKPQPHYPFPFVRGDALEFLKKFGRGFDVIHASPPCKVHTTLKRFSAAHHTNMVPDTRRLLKRSGRPWVIENVPGCPMERPIVLCGSMFDLGVRRHRLFESNLELRSLKCRHEEQALKSPGYPVKQYHSGKPVITISPVVGVYGRGQGLGPGEKEIRNKAMGIDWMNQDELREAIPPSYTEYIGRQLMDLIRGD